MLSGLTSQVVQSSQTKSQLKNLTDISWIELSKAQQLELQQHWPERARQAQQLQQHWHPRLQPSK